MSLVFFQVYPHAFFSSSLQVVLQREEKHRVEQQGAQWVSLLCPLAIRNSSLSLSVCHYHRPLACVCCDVCLVAAQIPHFSVWLSLYFQAHDLEDCFSHTARHRKRGGLEITVLRPHQLSQWVMRKVAFLHGETHITAPNRSLALQEGSEASRWITHTPQASQCGQVSSAMTSPASHGVRRCSAKSSFLTSRTGGVAMFSMRVIQFCVLVEPVPSMTSPLRSSNSVRHSEGPPLSVPTQMHTTSNLYTCAL